MKKKEKNNTQVYQWLFSKLKGPFLAEIISDYNQKA